MAGKEIREFETERLFLRGVRLSDAENIEKHIAHWDIVKNFRYTFPWPYPKGGARDFINSVLPKQGVDVWVWGLFLKENKQELIGVLSLHRKGNPGNRGFWLAKKYWGKGLMTEAVQPVLDYAFEELNFSKLIFDNAIQNKTSRRIKEKTGCKYIGTRSQKFVNKEYTESEVWELTKEAWQAFRKK